MADKKKPQIIVRYRDSETGQFVKKPYADRHPATTEKQHIRRPSGSSTRNK
jgi:hypothetical protein